MHLLSYNSSRKYPSGPVYSLNLVGQHVVVVGSAKAAADLMVRAPSIVPVYPLILRAIAGETFCDILRPSSQCHPSILNELTLTLP